MNLNFPYKKAVIFAVPIIIIAGVMLFYSLKPQSKELNLPIPFSTQAPTGNWDGNENCEETSAIMAYQFLNGNREDELPADMVQSQISKLIAWEQANLKHSANTGAEETGQMIQKALDLKTNLLKDFTENDFKKTLQNQQVILLPLNAQLLAPANYSNFHPTYHMVVVRGYDEKGFFINDPGTGSGKNNHYTFNELKSAASDWNATDKKIDTTKKTAIIVSK
jgi:hypothetical protein